MKLLPKKTPMPLQDSKTRVNNFEEVALGYDIQLAVAEAQRCLNCKNKPCVDGCPVGIEIPDFIAKVKEKDFVGAFEVISHNSCLPSICGRVCPQESQCESRCTLGIKFEPVAIGWLERFVADYHRNNVKEISQNKPNNGQKVAVIGSGPACLSCAGELSQKGYDVTVFEALHEAGGVLTYGIPQFRLPKEIVKYEIEKLKNNGVKIETNVVIGKTLTIEDLFERGFKAIFLGVGAGLPKFMSIKGENLKGVYSANEFLTRANLMKAYQNNSFTPIMHPESVVVVGGGNVAMDAARTALRLGAKKVSIVYRRSMNELPARKEEVEHAIEEGIDFVTLTKPIEILSSSCEGNATENNHGFVNGMKVIHCKLGEPDANGRRLPIDIDGSENIIDCDCVIIAIGTTPNPLISKTTPQLKTDRRGCVITDCNSMTSINGVFAGGDAVTGAATVILAMGAGKKAASDIDNYIKQKFN